MVSGLGGRSLRSGDFAQFPFVAAGFSTDGSVQGANRSSSTSSEFGFAQVDVTANVLTISYIAADDGAVIDSFTIGKPDDTSGPDASVSVPLDNGVDDLDSATNSVQVNQTQTEFRVALTDALGTVDDATVTSGAVILTLGGTPLQDGTDYDFSHDAGSDVITLASIGGRFGNGQYAISLSSGAAQIADVVGNAMSATTLNIEIDTTISLPVTSTFQNGVDGYSGTVDTSLRSSSRSSDNSANTSLEIDSSSAKHSLLRFDDIFGDGAAQIPTNATIQSATLQFEVFDKGDPPSLHRMLTAWTGTATWDSFGSGVQTDGSEAATQADTTFSGLTGTTSLDVTAATAGLVGGAGDQFRVGLPAQWVGRSRPAFFRVWHRL